MRSSQTGVDVANLVRMLRSRFPGPIVVVEGPKDVRIYERVLAGDACRFVPALSKHAAVEAARILNADGFDGFVGIVDRDFASVSGEHIEVDNLFATDLHDLETMLIASPALEKLLTEYASPSKLAGKGVRSLLLSAGETIGALRYVSLRDGLALSFEGLTFSSFIDKGTLGVDADAMIREVKNKSQKFDLDSVALGASIDALAGKHDPWHVACGHDLVEIFSLSLRQCFGSSNSKETTPAYLERSLRIAYEKAYFAQTDLYARLREWQDHNGFGLVSH